MKYLWRKWMKFAKVFSNFQTNIILSIIFFLMVLPLSFFIKLFFPGYVGKISSKPQKGKYWVKKEEMAQDLAWARKQG